MGALFRQLLASLSILVMVGAQVFGLQRGFICDCGGVAEVTQVDHCHGPHSEACHEEERLAPCYSADIDGDTQSTHRHSALIERVVAGRASTSNVVAPAVTVYTVTRTAFEVMSLANRGVAPSRSAIAFEDRVRLRPWPEVLSHTIELRI